MTSTKTRIRPEVRSKRTETWGAADMTCVRTVRLKACAHTVAVQPARKTLPPLEFVVDQVVVTSTWKSGQRLGQARVSLRVRLVMGSGALSATHGVLTLAALVERPAWLVDLIDRALPVVDAQFEIS